MKGQRRLTEPPDPDDPVVDDKDENFDLQKGDAKNEIVDGIPSITFSEKVHQFIAKRMSRRVIVKLLGRRISYLTTCNKLKAI
ncbi:hypothetical protein GOBAR_DD34099 [Gossypium barbadense]|nr:hypothetical protein GOBAR_DD34099 [Gossypium barbadense]